MNQPVGVVDSVAPDPLKPSTNAVRMLNGTLLSQWSS